MTAIIIIGIIIFIIYVVSIKEKKTNIPNYKKFNVANTANQLNLINAKLMQENMTANLKIIENIRIKCRVLAKNIEKTYESKICPICNGRKMFFLNVDPTGQFITCQCSNCSKVQTLRLMAGENGLKAIQLRDEIKHLIELFKLPVDEAFWSIEIDYSFMVNSEPEPDPLSSKNNIIENLDKKVISDSIIDSSNIKAEFNVFIKEKPQRVVLYNFEGKVAYWENCDIFSHTQINDANVFQKIFYKLFKTRFLNDDYIDLQGNINYAFILYFDLMEDYSKHRDIEKLEKQLLILAECYPNTKRFALKSLEDEFVLRGELKRAEKLKNRLINEYDNSIIDITNLNSKTSATNILQKYSYGVPNWAHHYVYSLSEINSATKEQKEFYSIFKSSFLKGEYIDIEGNTNYAFILLYDLLNESESHNDIPKLENQLKTLGQYYPKTKSYGVSFLIQKMSAMGDKDGVSRFLIENRNSSLYDNSDNDNWSFGSKYKSKLKLNNVEESLFNGMSFSRSRFSQIPVFQFEIFQLFYEIFKYLSSEFALSKTSIEYEFNALSQKIAIEFLGYKEGQYDIRPAIHREIYNCIWKYSENYIRSEYGISLKVNIFSSYYVVSAKELITNLILSKIDNFRSKFLYQILQIEDDIEIELNIIKNNRWKIKFEELTTHYNDKPKEFVDSIVLLGKLNKKNPSIENIFFEASKFIAKYDKESALYLFIHYLYYDLKSATFDNRQFTTTIQKNLFKTTEQLHDFKIIVSELITDRNLEKALKGVAKVYEVKRKKIQLDSKTINEVQQKHTGTVELLNEYLKDEYEDETNAIKTQESGNEEIEIIITQKNEPVQSSAFITEIAFTPIHITALELFSKSNFSIPQIELEAFAKSKGVFKNQLIESINETCYDFLDDVLIEEEDDYYTINTNYFQRIAAK